MEEGPPRKRSKWDVQASREEEQLQKEKMLQARLRAAQAQRRASASVSSSPKTPVSLPPGSTRPDMNFLAGARSVYCFEKLNHIEEGSYGVVTRARDKQTGEIVALKKLKMEQEKNGFPITSLREIRTLMACSAHENIVQCKEVVVGDTLTQIFLVFEFVEHDLKTLLSTMQQGFLQSEIKTLMLQLFSAIAFLHDNWIVHRDIKTSNLLMNNRGQIKVADFGLARTYGEPLGEMTQLVVTLWYRSPELLLGAADYSTAVDMWSLGCVFAELIDRKPLLPGKGEIDQMHKIFKLLGRPTEEAWPGFTRLPTAKSLNLGGLPLYSNLRSKVKYITEAGFDLLSSLLTYDPDRRITAEQAMRHAFFSEHPPPKHPDLFQSFPSVAAGERRKILNLSPSAPRRVKDELNQLLVDPIDSLGSLLPL